MSIYLSPTQARALHRLLNAELREGEGLTIVEGTGGRFAVSLAGIGRNDDWIINSAGDAYRADTPVA